MGGAKFCRFALFPLMLLMLLFVPTRMVAQTPTEDSRYALFKNLEGITDVTITDNGSYPWQELDLNAEGMTNLGFTIPEGSKGLMSSNYNVDGSSSETVVNFTVEKPMLLTFKYLVSSEYNFDKATITLDNKEPWTISEKKQIEIKALLSVGEHSLKLSYTKDGSGNEYADRTCIYDLKTATTFSEYVADYVATNSTLTFKKITSDNLEGLDLSRLAMVDNIDGVQDVCTNYSSIKNIVFDESFKTYAPTSLREFFKGCETLETISDLEYLNTAKVTDMGKMFHGCSALTSLDLTNFNTANVEFMDNMFEGCSALKSLDLTNFNTAKVTYMSCMFKGCSALESLNLTNFNTENVTDMSWMFYGCSALKSLDLTNFNTAKVAYMNNMFEGCSALTTIYVSNKFVTDNVSNGSDMFTGCKSLKDYSDSKTDHTYANCGTTGYFTPVFDYAEFDNATGTLTFRRGLSKPEGAYDLNEGNTKPGWLTQKEDIKKVVFDASFANARPTSCCKWFDGCQKLTEIKGIENLNTQNVTDMSSMFSDCQKLTSLDLSNFNTANVKYMRSMFGFCQELTSLNVTNFNTANVEDMRSMFKNCSALTGIFASNKFVTDQVIDGSDMFSGCDKLIGAIKYIGSQTDHHYANYENGYFSPEGGFPAYAVFDGGTRTLTFGRGLSKPAGAYDLNVGNNTPEWSTQKDDINKVVFDASFANARPTSCYYWFCGCSKLTDIEGIENLNTENVTNMNSMFDRCLALTSLDLTNFSTAKVSDMSYMFMGCSALTTIFVSDKFVTDQVTDGREMFHMCINLIGAIEYDGSKSDHTYANYENGYFSPEGGFHAYAEFDGTGTLTFRRGVSKPEEAYDLNEGANAPAWSDQSTNISKVVFDASFANARPTSCYKWFYMCTSLTEIEGIENLNTEEVTNMGSMFSGCYDLTQLDLSNFDTQNVENMSDMFVSCLDLKSLNVSNFDTQKVKDMNDMFYHCPSLTSLDVSNFDTQNVEDMSYMFSSCEGLTSLDLSNFDTQKVTDMSDMFWDSSALTTIYVSDKFVTTKVSSGAKMFQGCTNLKGFIDYISNKDKDNYKYANYTTGYFTKLVGKNGEEKIGATGKTLATENLVLDDGKDFVAYEPFAAKNAFYIRVIPEGSTWGTLCLPFAIGQSQETECKFYRLTGIDNDNECITLESCEEGIIPAGTPVLFKMNEGEQTLSISTKDASIVKEPVAGTNTDVNLVGSFTKIGGKDNQGLAENDYIIGKDKFWRVSDLDDGNRVGIKPMRAYIHPATASLARAAMLSIGKGDGTTAIDNLNAISNDANAEYYDANGRRTNGLQKGLNIVKRGSKTYKIMVK
jgi:surface protein